MPDLFADLERVPEFSPALLDVDGVARRLNITVRHVRRLVFERRIPYLKVRSRLRFDPDEIAIWLCGLRVRATNIDTDEPVA